MIPNLNSVKGTNISALVLASLTLFMLLEYGHSWVQQGFANLLMCILTVSTFFLVVGIATIYQPQPQQQLQRLLQLQRGPNTINGVNVEELSVFRRNRHFALLPIIIMPIVATIMGVHTIVLALYDGYNNRPEYILMRLMIALLTLIVVWFAYTEYREVASDDLVEIESIASYYTSTSGYAGGILANSGGANSPFAGGPLTPVSLIPTKGSSC